MPILAIIDDLVNDEHMVITWVTAFLLLNIEKINKQAFCQMFISGYWLFLLLIKFGNFSTLECYSCCEHSLVPLRHCAPSSKMTILTKTKILLTKQNDDSDENKMTIATKKWQFWQNTASLTLITRFMRFAQSRALKGEFL